MGEVEDELLDLEPGENLERGRPSFLTGLCITSWAGCAFQAITTGYSLWMYRQIAQEGGMETNYMLLTLLNLACTFTVAGGVAGMWNLKKWGFFVYLIGELAPVGISLFYIASAYSSFGEFGFSSLFLNVSGIVSYLIPVIFCFLYGTHYKFLK